MLSSTEPLHSVPTRSSGSAPEGLPARFRAAIDRTEVHHLVTGLVFAAIAVLAFTPAIDPDVFWHQGTGRWIWANRSIPKADPFSWTTPGRKWIAHEWLTETIYRVLYVGFGWGGIVVFSALAILASFAVVRATTRRLGVSSSISSVLAFLAAVSCVHTWGARPQMLSLLFTSLFLWILTVASLGVARGGRAPEILALCPAIMLAWVNLHGGYIFGVAILLAFAVARTVEPLGSKIGRRRNRFDAVTAKQAWTTFAVTSLVTLINPNGLDGFLYPFSYLGDNASTRYVGEWFAPKFSNPQYWPFALLLVAFAILLAFNWRSLPLFVIAIGLPFAGLAVQSARNISQFVVVATPWIGAWLHRVLTARRAVRSLAAATQGDGLPKTATAATAPADSIEPAKARVNAAILAIVFVATAAVALSNLTPGANEAAQGKEYPTRAIAHLLENPEGRLFNNYNWGGVLIDRAPSIAVYVDGRPDMYGDAFMDRFISIWRAKPGWQQRLDEDKVDRVFVPPKSALGKALRTTAGWTVDYEDDQAVIFVRSR